MIPRYDRTAWLKGGEARCLSHAPRPKDRYHLVLLGAPGVGKGTQAELLSEHLKACHLSTGDVFRAAKCLAPGERSPALEEAMRFMSIGELVPDTTVIDLVGERARCLRCPGGFLLDGFPRTVAQAEALDQLLRTMKLQLSAVVDYELPFAEIISRLSGRRTCSKCKSVFHVTGRRPRTEGVCDHCGGQLFQRDDDRPEAIEVRMHAYEESTRPLFHYYEQRGILISVPAHGSPEETFQRTLEQLEQHHSLAYEI